MIYSMTGFGKSILQLPSKKVTVEVKSLNSKNLDVNARIPSLYREKEGDIRRLLSKSLERGKIDLSIYIEQTEEEQSTRINELLVRNYIGQLKQINDGIEEDYLSIAMRLPDVLKTEREELDIEEWEGVTATIEDAVKGLTEFRLEEGKFLEADLILRIETIEKLLDEVIALDEERLVLVRERLRKAISELTVTVDENRFEQELIYYLEKLDITEEKTRLTNHLDYFKKEMKTQLSNGKKLGFISQEIGREINTIGSKANFAPMQNLVVQMKDELEKIKEQLLNIL
ncbi:YicC/YloC family endoribonuclease [Namhaeicola litoreus]|uniref:YicC/YloC family endoribonuclease n=1 Tax=Namhaeicola litoreus TaxID=1052145 RepID=A0ABW3Y145_9FLAO